MVVNEGVEMTGPAKLEKTDKRKVYGTFIGCKTANSRDGPMRVNEGETL